MARMAKPAQMRSATELSPRHPLNRRESGIFCCLFNILLVSEADLSFYSLGKDNAA